MARARNVIDVLIIGDAKKLVGAFNQANKSMGGLLGSAAKAFIGLKAIDQGFEFIQDAQGEADRLGDAMQRLGGQLGADFTARLDETADDFARLGQSRQDILEMEAAFADLSTAIELTDGQITMFAPTVAEMAAKMALVKDVDAATVIEQIGKAANGSIKAAQALGVTLLDTKDSGVQMSNILTQLQTRLQDVGTGAGDVEQKQAELGARWETLTGQVGQLIEGPLNDLLGWMIETIDLIPSAIDGFGMLGDTIADAFENALSPLARLNDALGEMGRLVRSIPFVGEIFGGGGGGVTESSIRRANDLFNERNLQGRP